MFFRKIKNNIFRYFLDFFSFPEKIKLLKINKKFSQLIKESKNFKYFDNVKNNLMNYSFSTLLSDNSYKIEEFLSIELSKKKIHDEIEWNQLLEVVLFFLSRKILNNKNKISPETQNCKFLSNNVYFPNTNQIKAIFYLNKSIKLLNVSKINMIINDAIINKKSGKSLAKLLNKNKIEKFEINNCQITSNGLKEFLNILGEFTENFNSLKSLKLSYCYLKDNIISKIIYKLAEKNFCNLEALDLSCNNIKMETLIALKENSKILQIKKLIMDKCVFANSKISSMLRSYIIDNKALSKLSLLASEINEVAFLQIISILNKNYSNIISFGISVRNFSQEVYTKFFNQICSYKRLKTLKITVCNFSLHAIICVSRILSDPDCSLKKIEFNKVDFKFSFSKDFPYLIAALINNNSLTSLNFSDCYFSEEQVNLISDVVCYKRFLGLKISNSSFFLSQKFLENLKYLKKLTLTNNDFKLSDLKELIIYTKKNNNKNFENLEVLNLSKNPFIFPDLDASDILFEILLYYKNLKKIILKDNFINKVDQERLQIHCENNNRNIFLEL